MMCFYGAVLVKRQEEGWVGWVGVGGRLVGCRFASGVRV